MMNRLILMAWGVFFTLHAQTAHANYAKGKLDGIYKNSSPIYTGYTRSPEFWGKEIVAEITNPNESAVTHLNRNVSINFTVTKDVNQSLCEIDSGGGVTCDGFNIGTLRWSNVTTSPTGEETATCNLFAGDEFFNPNQKDICADTGVTTGGTNSQPLYCMSEWLGGITSESKHKFTSTQCSALDPDPTPDPDPDPDPNPDPDPDPEPEPDPGTPGGSGQPTSGNTGTATGTNGDQAVNLVMDFRPVTERLDMLRADQRAHTNYLGQQIAAGTAANVAATNSLKPLLEAIGAKTDAVGNAVTDGTAQIKGELVTLNETGKAIEGAIKEGNTQLGEKLDGIKEGIDKLTDGIPIDGEYAANQTQLPDYDTAVRDGIQQVQDKVSQYAGDSGLDDLTDRETVAGMFSAAESFADVFDIARSGCSAIPFGSHGTFDVCDAAPTISWVLEIVIWALTALFIFHFIAGLLTRERLS